jgi:hypothetical protein
VALAMPPPSRIVCNPYNAAYVNGLCTDCKSRPPSAGHVRCDDCHRIHTNVMAGYNR